MPKRIKPPTGHNRARSHLKMKYREEFLSHLRAVYREKRKELLIGNWRDDPIAYQRVYQPVYNKAVTRLAHNHMDEYKELTKKFGIELRKSWHEQRKEVS